VSTIDDDRAEIFRQHKAYLEANSVLDPTKLVGVWGPDPSNVYFNLSGHTYRGLDQWSRLWDYYRDRLDYGGVPYTSWDQQIRVEGDVGWLTSSRFGITKWVGIEESPFPEGFTPSRSTEIFVRSDEGWRCVHTHFSRASTEPRPGGI
jgi:ketosteroid isomerase-like protein